MKHRIQGMLAGFLMAILLSGTIAYAATGQQAGELFYNNIKIFVDGAQFTAKDANGNTVEPFTMNGTTYLPVRAIANAFDKDVIWDGETASIYLGKKDQNQPDNYLDRIQYTDYQNAHTGLSGHMWKMSGEVIDFLGDSYKSGMLFENGYYGSYFSDLPDKACNIISYPINMQYKNLNGKIVLPKTVNLPSSGKTTVNSGSLPSVATVLFYGDGKLLYTAKNVTTSMPFDIDINLKGVNTLTIRLLMDQGNTYVALTDLALYK